MSKPRLALSNSGGRSSAVMTRLCLDKYGDSHEIVTLFANTGCEDEATLDFVKDCDDNWGFNTVWLEAVINPIHNKGTTHRVTNYADAVRDTSIYEQFVSKYGIPNHGAKMGCTRELKKAAIDSYLQAIGWHVGKISDHQVAIGVRADESDRLDVKDPRIFTPLAEWGYTKEDVNTFMRKVPWDLNLKSDAYGNCCKIPCFKKSLRKLYTVAIENPALFDEADRLEKAYGHIHNGGDDATCLAPDGRRYFYRGHRSSRDIVFEARSLVGTGAIRLYSDNQQLNIWDEISKSEWDAVLDLDTGDGCDDHCEVY